MKNYKTASVAALFSLALVIGITAFTTHAQTAAAAAPLSPEVAHNIEVTVRNHFNLPPETKVTISNPSAGSDIPGYSDLLVTVFKDGKEAGKVNMLLSADQKTLMAVARYDVSQSMNSSIPVDGRPIRGNPQAPVKVIVFDDLECPYCAMMHKQVFPTIADEYKDKVAFIYKDYPLVEIHPWAMHAAVDVNCIAADKSPRSGDAYWHLVDNIHSHLKEIQAPEADAPNTAAKSPDGEPAKETHLALQTVFARLDKMTLDEAKASGLNVDTVAACVKTQDQTAIQASVKFGNALGLDATPTLYIDGEKLDGVVPNGTLEQILDRALQAHGVQPPAHADAEAPPAPDKPATPAAGVSAADGQVVGAPAAPAPGKH